MEQFTPFASALGGILIGLAAALLWVLNGRIAGISGILSRTIPAAGGRVGWQAIFVAGLIAGGVTMWALMPESFAVEVDRSAGAVVAAGLLVGFGTRLGNGCTSGHGVCGLSRFSTRSLVATASFMAAGALTVFVVNHLLGGSL